MPDTRKETPAPQVFLRRICENAERFLGLVLVVLEIAKLLRELSS